MRNCDSKVYYGQKYMLKLFNTLTLQLERCGILVYVYTERVQDGVKLYQILKFVLLRSDETNGKKIWAILHLVRVCFFILENR